MAVLGREVSTYLFTLGWAVELEGAVCPYADMDSKKAKNGISFFMGIMGRKIKPVF